jgi:hypothetical protein
MVGTGIQIGVTRIWIYSNRTCSARTIKALEVIVAAASEDPIRIPCRCPVCHASIGDRRQRAIYILVTQPQLSHAQTCAVTAARGCTTTTHILARSTIESIIASALSNNAVAYTHIGAFHFDIVSNVVCTGVPKPC